MRGGLLVVLLLLLVDGAFGRNMLSLPDTGAKPRPHPLEYPQLTEGEVDKVAFIIDELITQSKLDDGTHPFLAGFVRLIFHDCVGVACDGCVNSNYGPNGGLEPYFKVLNATYHDPIHLIGVKMSQADFWALAGIVAARRGAEKGGQTLTTKFRTGRKSCSTSPNTPVEDEYPDAHADTSKTLDYWKDYFGFTYYETVALIGAHSLGKCHRDGSGFDGPWTTDKDSLDNAYYSDMSNPRLGWMQKTLDAEHVQWVHGDGSAGMMLNADMAMYKNIEPAPMVSHCSYSTCNASRVAGAVETFAADNALFITEFSQVFEKLMEHGYSNLMEVIPNGGDTLGDTRVMEGAMAGGAAQRSPSAEIK